MADYMKEEFILEEIKIKEELIIKEDVCPFSRLEEDSSIICWSHFFSPI